MAEKTYQTFAEFWPYYVREHGNRVNRFLHLVGTTGGLLLLLTALATRTWWLLAIAPVFGYGFAWIGHFFIEKNRPATFTYPLWSLMGDLKMMTYMLQGRMGPEIVSAFDRRHLRETTEKKKGSTMNRLLLIVAFSMAASAEARTDLLDPAWETRQNVTDRLAECGTEEFQASDPRLPTPRVPAHRAYVAENGLAGYHYRRTLSFAQDFRWIRPNGGAVAWMTVTGDEEIEFGTTTGGTQARMSRYFTPAGEFFNYWCGSNQVNAAVFHECVETRWVQYLLVAFCAP